MRLRLPGILFLVCGALISITGSAGVWADVRSTDNTLHFDVNSDGIAEASLTAVGLGLGVTPAANLHVLGNAIITGKLGIGTSSPRHNLDISGTMAFVPEQVSDNISASGNSFIFANTGSGNINIYLPDASTNNGRLYSIKKTSSSNVLSIYGELDNFEALQLPSTTLGYLKVLSGANTWNILSMSSDAVSSIIGGDNLVGWWKFNESSFGQSDTFADSSGHGSSATVYRTNSWVNGVSGGALHFWGLTNKYVSTGLTLPDGGRVSFAFWAKFDNFNGLQTSGEQEGGRRLYMGIKDSGVYLGFANMVKDSPVAHNMSVKTWHHLCLTGSGSTARFYIDGAEVYNFAYAWTAGAGTSTMRLGDVLGTNMSAALDDVRVYNYELSASDVSNLVALNQVSSSNLLGWWKFDDGTGSTTALDSAGSNNGTLVSMNTESNLIPGRRGNAMYFYGSCYAVVTAAAHHDIVGPVSISAWVSNPSSTALEYILSKGNSTNQYAFALKFERLYMNANGADNEAYSNSLFTADGTWRHLAIVFTPGQSVKTYINGVSVAMSDSTLDTMSSVSGNITIGGMNEGSNFFGGTMDDLRLYNKALSATEIDLIYRIGL